MNSKRSLAPLVIIDRQARTLPGKIWSGPLDTGTEGGWRDLERGIAGEMIPRQFRNVMLTL